MLLKNSTEVNRSIKSLGNTNINIRRRAKCSNKLMENPWSLFDRSESGNICRL